MGRGARIKCIKCPPPPSSFMNGLKDLQSSVMRPSIIATAACWLWCRLQREPRGRCREEYNFICQLSHLNIDASEPRGTEWPRKGQIEVLQPWHKTRQNDPTFSAAIARLPLWFKKSEVHWEEQNLISALPVPHKRQCSRSTGGDVHCHSPWRHAVCLLERSQALRACLHVYETICQPTQPPDLPFTTNLALDH